jgi:hypothetical protein
MGAPAGGPPDFTPPQLIGTFPESLTVIEGFDDWVEFRFDEVIAEGNQPNFGYGTGDLERLILFSPDTAVPQVRWRRDRIAIRPAKGWRPGVVYRIELAPGVTDLRQNDRETGSVITFSTGGPLPTNTLHGTVVDWVGRRFVPRALVEATLVSDSLTYRTLADSTGAFSLGPLPDGEYLVRGMVDENGNRRRELRDAWDTVRIAAGRDSVGEIWAFQQDTAPPRATGATRVDSFTIAVTMSQPVDPALRIGTDSVFVLLLPDSASLGAVSALPETIHDSIYKPIDEARRSRARAAADSTPVDTLLPRADTLPVTPSRRRDAVVPEAEDTVEKLVPQEPRPPLGFRLMIRTGGPLQSGSNYRIEIYGVRAASGVTADTIRTGLQIAPDTRRDADSLKADSVRADSIKAAETTRVDSVVAPRPDSIPPPAPNPPVPTPALPPASASNRNRQ